MAGETENLVLEHLRAIRADIADVKRDMREFRERLGHIENQMASHYALYATLSTRLDRVVEDVQLIKRRLDLVDA
jgi:septal ring factor EnvC (AmiA/AmiB activator)